MEKIEKVIKVTPEIRAELMKRFQVSEKTIYNALTFATGGYTAKMIRLCAVELGGKFMAEVATCNDNNELKGVES